jgi:ankyrin repeat protein
LTWRIFCCLVQVVLREFHVQLTSRISVVLAVLAFLPGAALASESLNRGLLQAAEHNDVPAMRMLLDQGADPNWNGANIFRYPVVLVAASHGNVAAVRLLLSRGADANARDVRGTPILISAVALAFGSENPAGVIESVRLLVEMGRADPNATDTARIGDDRGPLHQAAANGSLELIQLLLQAGARPDQANRFGETPLHFAAERGQVRAAQALLAGGARPDARSRFTGMTPLMGAAEHGRMEMVQFLLQNRADRRVRNAFGKTPIELARAAAGRDPASPAARRYQAVIEALRDAGAS